MDFHITNGRPELDLELNSGERVRKPIDVKRPSVTGVNVCASKVMSVDELLDMDDIEFQLHDQYDNSPGVLLKKSGSIRVKVSALGPLSSRSLRTRAERLR